MSGAMSRRKGARAETAVANWLRNNGFPSATRRLTGRHDDIGDIGDIGPSLVIEVKDHQQMTLAAWIDQLADETLEAGADTGVIIHKRRGRTDVGDWYATMPAAAMIRLLRDAGHGDPNENQ